MHKYAALRQALGTRMSDVVELQDVQRGTSHHACEYAAFDRGKRHDGQHEKERPLPCVFRKWHVSNHGKPSKVQSKDEQQHHPEPETRHREHDGCSTHNVKVECTVALPGGDHSDDDRDKSGQSNADERYRCGKLEAVGDHLALRLCPKHGITND